MKRLLALLFVAMLACVCSAQTVTVSATNVHDATQTKLASGQACFMPTDNSGNPISFKDAGGGQVEAVNKCVSVTNGAFSVSLPDTSLTNPANVCFRATVKNTANAQVVISTGYECVQPTANNSWCTSGTCNFDNYVPSGQSGVVQVAGPTGPQGPPGIGVDSSANINFTGNDNFTGITRHRDSDGVYYTSPEIDSLKTACKAISDGFLYASAHNGGTVDASAWHGVQDCLTDLPFASYPYTLGGQPGFEGHLIRSPDLTLVVHSTVHLPNTLRIDGGSGWQQGSVGMAPAGMFEPGNDFPTNTPVVEYSDTGSTGTNPRGIWMSGVGVNCITPNGTYLTGSIGIRNQNAQELSGGDHIHIQGCNIGLDLENSGWLLGAQNSGGWNDIVISSEGIPLTNTGFMGIRYGSTTGAGQIMGPMRAIRGLTITAPQTASNTTPCIAVDGFGFHLEDFHLENCVNGAEVGANKSGVSAIIKNGHCVSQSGWPMSACVHISSAISTNGADVQLEQIRADANVTNAVKDDEEHGHTIAATNLPNKTLGFYSATATSGFGAGRTVVTNFPDAASNLSITGNAATATTATTALACPNCTGGVTTVAADTNLTLDSTHNTMLIRGSPVTHDVTVKLNAIPPSTKWWAVIKNAGTSGFNTIVDPNGINLDGSTSTIALPANTAIFIWTNGTVYYSARWVTTYSGTTASIGGSALAAGACASGTATITGVVAGQTGTATASDGTNQDNYFVRAYASAANTATVKVCAITAGTPTAKTYNVRILP